MTDEELKAMSKDDANEKLGFDDKYRWVRLNNATANLYFVRRGQIKDGHRMAGGIKQQKEL